MYVTQDIADRIKWRLKEKGIRTKDMLSDLNMGINAISEFAKASKCPVLPLLASPTIWTALWIICWGGQTTRRSTAELPCRIKRAFPPGTPGGGTAKGELMRNIALKLMYNGTAYHGWQVQKNAVTVCGTLEKAIADICGGPVHLTGCGRTDAGVHAEHYIANFRTESRIPVDRLPFAVNTHTPEDIAVKEAFEVAEDFNAIGSCIKKEYTYRIYNSRFKNPFYVNRAYFYPKHLDEEFLTRAAGMFVGTHDFAAVRSVGTETKSTVRTIYYCDVTRNGDLLELKVCANGFLYNMVRAITGTVLYAAEGKFTPEDIPGILERGDRTAAGPTVPPGGLYLTRLWYEDERLNG